MNRLRNGINNFLNLNGINLHFKLVRYAMKGFTLIELLVVIAIIGVLSSIVLASLSTARSKANDSKVEEQLSSMRSAAEIFYTVNNGYVAVGTATYLGLTSAACAYGTSPTSGTWGTGVLFDDLASSGAHNVISGIASTSGVTSMSCVASTTAWAVAVPLPSGGTGMWCTDSTGKSKNEASTTYAVSATQLCI